MRKSATEVHLTTGSDRFPRTITDAERAEFLRFGGYLPYGFDNEDTRTWDPTRVVDFAITNRYGPAYWREPQTDSEIYRNMPPRGNGLVFHRPVDRDRIDQCILARQ